MEVVRYDDPAAFRRDGARVLLADAARNNLPLAILQVLLDQPEMYPVFHLWIAVRDGQPGGLALQTEPYNVLLADPLEDDAVDALAEAAVVDSGPLPGITANLPWADRFATRVTAMTGGSVERILDEGVWELTTVAEVPAPGGAARIATPGDRDLLRHWLRAFAEEALPPERPWDDAHAELDIDLRLAGRGGGYWLWDDGAPVSLSGHRHVPGVGTRIGPVYTPPQHRRRGYATRLVAELSATRLALGDPACFLFTDMANPTSNAIYARIGYEKVCEAVEYAFHGAP
ncbi:MAG: GNAT family N-acetyltransferase [Actinomycetota bacterium]|nr:GNAT family N-acetyltransferase [Chloroflexota bacterium]MDP9327411.1 GNAT family N-acetyltransferase [Actinomycetota bacterium]